MTRSREKRLMYAAKRREKQKNDPEFREKNRLRSEIYNKKIKACYHKNGLLEEKIFESKPYNKEKGRLANKRYRQKVKAISYKGVY